MEMAWVKRLILALGGMEMACSRVTQAHRLVGQAPAPLQGGLNTWQAHAIQMAGCADQISAAALHYWLHLVEHGRLHSHVNALAPMLVQCRSAAREMGSHFTER